MSAGRVTNSILLLLLCVASSSDGLRILGVFPLHGKSHFVMCERLMKGLVERGHQVDVYSHFPLKKPMANYTDHSLAGSIPLVISNMTFDMFTRFSKSAFEIADVLKLTGTPVCKLLDLPVFQELINNPPKDPPYDIVIVEIFMANCFLALGRHLNLPMAVVATMPLFDWHHESLGNPNNPATDKSVYSQPLFPIRTPFLDRLNNVIFSVYSKLSFGYHVREQDAMVHKAFGKQMPNALELQKDISLALINYHQALNGIRPFAPAVVPVGCLHVVDNGDELPKKVQKFLDESKHGFVYFSFGSMVQIETFPRQVLDAFFNTFKKIAPVRVLMKVPQPEKLPPGLPSNVLTQPWFSQVKVLKHKNIKAFVTHGGLMGTQEAIYYGVPLIGFPLFGDQHSNLDLYVEKNLAIKLDRTNVTEKAFSDAVFEILKNPKYKKSAEKISQSIKDVPMDPMDTAAFWIEYIVRHGKDALRSPVVDMPWWQASLLDIYGFIAAIVFITICIVKVVLKTLIGLLTSKKPQQKVKKN